MNRKTSLTIVTSFLLVFSIFYGVHKTNANLSRIEVSPKGSLADYNGLSNPYSFSTTTSSSAVYVTTTSATSTNYFIVGTEPADMASLNMAVIASSTASVVRFQVEYSDDVMCTVPANSINAVLNLCNWYREDAQSTSGSVITDNSFAFHQFSSATTSTSTISVPLGTNGIIGHRYVKVSFAATGANYTIWAQIPRKVQIQGAQ